MARLSCWIYTHSYYLGARLCAAQLIICRRMLCDGTFWEGRRIQRMMGNVIVWCQQCYTSDGIMGCNCNLRLVCFSSSSFSPFLVKIQRMSLCQSMYNHTTRYGDMFIWEMAAIPTIAESLPFVWQSLSCGSLIQRTQVSPLEKLSCEMYCEQMLVTTLMAARFVFSSWWCRWVKTAR